MPISSKGFARSSLLLLVVGLVALLGIVGTAIWLVERTQSYFEDVIEARLARRAAVELRQLLQSAEASQRGYLITLDETYLDPYDEAIGAIIPAYDDLAEVLAAYPRADDAMAGMRENIDVKISEMTRTIDLAQSGEVESAISVVRTDTGQRAMADIQTLIAAIVEAADDRIFEGVVGQREAAGALRIVALVGGLVIILVAGGSILVVRRYTHELDLARDEVERLNRDLEDRVNERTQELMRANEEVQRFAYIVTHDLRAPLVNIMGFTSELEATLPPIRSLIEKVREREGEDADDGVITEARLVADEDLPEAITFIRSSTQKMDGLINAILKISREGKRELKAERLDLEEVVEVASGAVQHQVSEAGGEIALDVRTPPIYSDRLSLEQILGNLFDNAVKYKSPDRPLRVDVEARQERSGRIVIEVADNGRGIAPEDHDRVFELFRRSGIQNEKGEGIGLAHVRIMARNLGGDISLASEFGKGTTFTIYLAPDLRALRRSTA